MRSLEVFPANYDTARHSFRAAANRVQARLEAYRLKATGCQGEILSIEVALIGNPNPSRVLVVSSGLHGVEGFFGSAVQTAWLLSLGNGDTLPKNGAVVLLHALNPYGFSWLRRTNEDNIDLNRNFLLANEEFKSAQPGYAELNNFLNPSSPPSPWEPFRLKALWQILSRGGLVAVKNAVAVGQYDYPQGLFFGGHGWAESTSIIQEQFTNWLSTAAEIIHLDLHSGLGKKGQYKLLVLEPADSPELDWYRQNFGSNYVESVASSSGTAYQGRGFMGNWLAQHLYGRKYRYLAAEFGTYSLLRVLGALRAENRAHFYSQPSHPVYERAKAELKECFCPHNLFWRQQVLAKGLGIIQTCLTTMSW
jgi:hypothetical protein